MKRRLLTLAAAMSLALCLATVGLWVTSVFVWPRVDYGHWNSRKGVYIGWVLNCSVGHVGITRVRSNGVLPRDGTIWLMYTVPVDSDLPLSQRLGLQLPSLDYRDKPQFDGETAHLSWGLWLPCWLLVLLFATFPCAWMVYRVRSAGHDAAQQCGACGYDLRATPQRCPECGSIPDAAGRE